MKKILFIATFVLIISPWISAKATGAATEVFIFTQKGCLYCAKTLSYLEALKKDSYPDLTAREFDLRDNPKYFQKYKDFARAYKATADSVPMVYIGDKVIKGYLPDDVRNAIEYCENNDCPNPEKKVAQFVKETPDTSAENSSSNRNLIGWGVLGILGAAVIALIINHL